MDDEQRQKREIAKRREEDRKRREVRRCRRSRAYLIRHMSFQCQALNQSLPFNRHTDVDYSFIN